MDDNPRVSILLPARDAALTLPRAVNSCLSQTFSDFELVLVDDHSSDETLSLLHSYASRDHRVSVLKCPAPGGLVSALETARKAARGTLLARMDADDVMAPERLAEQVGYMDAHPGISVCGCGVRMAGPFGEGFARYQQWSNGLTEPEEIARERFVESPLVHPTAMIRREALEAAGGYRDSDWAEDYDLWLRMLEAGMKFGKVGKILLEWWDSPGRLTRASGRYSQLAFSRAKAHYLSRLPRVRQNGVMISGAGPTGKTFARLLKREGVAVHGFLDVNPRRKGRKIGGVPVFGVEDAGNQPGAPVQLAAVGSPEGRERVRNFLSSQGFTEGRDFFCVA